jgi:large subunit ribosomal protein L16
MGKGKGNVDYWVCPVRQGKILYEIGGIPHETAMQALQAGAAKLPLLTRIVF